MSLYDEVQYLFLLRCFGLRRRRYVPIFSMRQLIIALLNSGGLGGGEAVAYATVRKRVRHHSVVGRPPFLAARLSSSRLHGRVKPCRDCQLDNTTMNAHLT